MSSTPDHAAKLQAKLDEHLNKLRKAESASGASTTAAAATSTLKWSLDTSVFGWKKPIPFSKAFGFKPPSPYEDFDVPTYKPTDWNEEVRPFIPKVDAGFILEETLTTLAVLGYITGDNALLWGPKGSGKSTLPEQICARLGIPFIRIGMKEDMESSELLGTNTIRGKDVVWVNGPVTAAAMYGAVLCLDESSNITPGAAIALHPLLEENRRLILTDKHGSVAERNVDIDPRFRVFLTDNTNLQGDITGKYVGTKVQNEAFIDRIFTRLEVKYMAQDREIEMLMGRVPELGKDLAKLFVRFAELCRASYQQGMMQQTVSPRVLINWGRKAVTWGNLEAAYKVAYSNGLSDDDRKIASEHFNKVFSARI